jgi:hypothetical protein
MPLWRTNNRTSYQLGLFYSESTSEQKKASVKALAFFFVAEFYFKAAR